jgi:CO dehydrogenase maturation factor
MIIAVSGKGGTGKTTISALMIKHLIDSGKVPLAVDADPNNNLDIKLGAQLERTIGDLREDLLKDTILSGVSKMDYMDYQMGLALSEGEKFDLIAIGRPEGPGCYCYANNVLRTFLDRLCNRYEYVVMDTEAGLEHLSRRTTNDVDMMFLVALPSVQDVLTAKRIRNLAIDLQLNIKGIGLIVNSVRDGILDKVKESIERDFDGYYKVPYDDEVDELNSLGEPLLGVSKGSIAYRAVGEILRRAQ